MTQIPPGYADISVELRHTGMARSAYITWGVSMEGVSAALVADKALASVMLPAGSLYSLIDTTVTIVSATARIGQDGGEPLVYVAEGGNPGTQTLTGLPPNVAVLAHKRTARGGRRGRGRLFLPFVVGTGDVLETGLLSTSKRSSIQTVLNTFLTSCTTQGVPMYLLHNVSEPGTANPSAPGIPNAVTSLLCDPLISTQRRRLGR